MSNVVLRPRREYYIDDDKIVIVILAYVDNIADVYGELIKTAYNGKQQLIIDFSAESFAFVNNGNELVFDQLHQLIDYVNIPYTDVHYYSGNILNSQVYEAWRKEHSISNRINTVGYRLHWAYVVKNAHLDYSQHYDHNANRIRPCYFNCLNGAPRTHRLETVLYLWDNDLFKKNIVSLVCEDQHLKDILHFKGYSDLANMLPLSVDNHTDYKVMDSHCDYLADSFYSVYNNSYFDVTTETVYGQGTGSHQMIVNLEKHHWWQELFYTEKTFRSIYYKRPFLLYGSWYQLRRLREMGFKTFDGILFDESYDNISDWQQRLTAFHREISRVCNSYTLESLHNIVYSDTVKDILNYNYQHFLKLAAEHYPETFYKNVSS